MPHAQVSAAVTDREDAGRAARRRPVAGGRPARRRRGRAAARARTPARRPRRCTAGRRAASCPGSCSRSRSSSPAPTRCRSWSSTRSTPGVGGRAAVEVGRRLARLARDHQVLVVTHLPQVAAFADRTCRSSRATTAASRAAASSRSTTQGRVAELSPDAGRARQRAGPRARRGAASPAAGARRPGRRLTGSPWCPTVRELGPDDHEQSDALGRARLRRRPGRARRRAGAVPVAAPGACSTAGRLRRAGVPARPTSSGGAAGRCRAAGVAGVARPPRGPRPRHRRAAAAPRARPSCASTGLPVSALFPTVPAIYRGARLGARRLAGRDPAAASHLLRERRAPRAAWCVRTAGPEDAAGRGRPVRRARARPATALLTRTRPRFPAAPARARADVVALAVEDGAARRATPPYDRGRGYGRAGAAAASGELVRARRRGAAARCSASSPRWDPVVGVRPVARPGRRARPAARPAPCPRRRACGRGCCGSPTRRRAVAARGWAADVRRGSPSRSSTRDVAEHERRVDARRAGRRGPARAPARPVDAPRAARARPRAAVGGRRRHGARAARRPARRRRCPQLDAVLAGPRPELLDYF